MTAPNTMATAAAAIHQPVVEDQKLNTEDPLGAAEPRGRGKPATRPVHASVRAAYQVKMPITVVVTS
ncbi:hypothetical protein GCM10010269_34190 [Streptomyces humidus]|uniref:Uncharacterized protein n=1 Tax=Streptomyces humidus TaxID=52259 RepID=A0A918L3U1_9ACTN|nr:hypothetical protein GCM10010269_34190 [Streptomyces humidus]